MNHFSSEDQSCKCGCGLNLAVLNPDFLSMIELSAEACTVPFIITSWTRCAEHNRSVGGSKNSMHLKGAAVDILCNDQFKRYSIFKSLTSAGFSRFELTVGHIHVDARPGGLPMILINI